RKPEVWLAPPLPDDDVLRLCLAYRYRPVKDVWHAQQEVVELAFHRLRDRQLAFRGVRHLAQPFFERLVSRLRELLGELVLLGLDRLRVALVPAPQLVQTKDLVHRRR